MARLLLNPKSPVHCLIPYMSQAVPFFPAELVKQKGDSFVEKNGISDSEWTQRFQQYTTGTFKFKYGGNPCRSDRADALAMID